ncbi:Hpt domain-containing protein [Hydrogenophaga sp.]|uniref:hybrid sensor histidine kinase/response regulator n=1 Tax=Hydrogenophaga sp. TaxID=1904254 RepID=UPI002723E704|nr:Hpt domain-containing protein [Hydrogenophaga sp.]MDO9436817.1 Hpt domain-containing protein [Hydrogenophaga sp.]
MFDSATDTDSLNVDAPVADLGPLAWVFDELRKSLDGANKAIKRFVRENEQSRNNDLEAADPGSLRLARQQLHQAVGALEMVGLGAPAQVLRAMEAAVQRFVQRPNTCTEEAASKVERASFAMVEYLGAVLNNKPMQPVALFSQYREVQELAAAERIHPADLWTFEQRGIELAAPAGVAPLQCNAAIRSLFDRLVLLMVKTQSVAAASQLAKLSAGLSAGAEEVRARTFWRVSAGYFEAVAHLLLPADVYVKRATSRILLQFVNLAQGKPQVSETLLHDLLFFCAQPASVSADTTPHLAAVRDAFGLGSLPSVDYQQATLGRYDPAILAQARKRIQAAKEAWSLYSGGDNSRARQVADQFSLIGDSLLKLHPASTVLAQALVKAADQTVQEPNGIVRPELAMEVATTTLYLEAAFEDFDPCAPEFTERTLALAQRLGAVLAGESAQPLDTWMEQLYRRVSDRQTMGSVVGEIKVSLGEVEKSLDQFFRHPQEKAGLHVAVSQLAQMRGVLSVLGLDQAVQTVVRMRTSVEQILDTEVDEAMAREAGTFQQLGNNLSAMSFLVDMLNYQPALAKKLFVFDEEKGELLPLMGRVATADVLHQASRDEAQAISEGVQRVVEGAQGGVDLVDLSEQLGSLADQASLAEQSGVARAARDAAEAVIKDDAAAGAQALVGLSETSNHAPLVEPTVQSEEDHDEGDLLDIFLEEAREVVDNGLQAVSHLQAHPIDLEHLTTLRRAYHTLKGSSRMVGLDEFGDAAWAMEQLINTVLAEQRPASSPLLKLAEEAMHEFTRWVEEISARGPTSRRSQPFRASAEALREHGQYLPLAQVAPGTHVEAPLMGEVPAIDEGPVSPAATDVVVSEWDGVFDTTLPIEDELAAQPQWDAAPADVPQPVLESAAFLDQPDMLADVDFANLEPATSDDASAPQTNFGVGDEDGEPTEAIEPIEAREAVDAVDEVDAVEAFEVVEAVELSQPLFVEPQAVAVEEDVVPESTPEPEPEPELMEEPGFDATYDEQTRVIGSLRIGLKLYNVYLNEADEWSRRLNTVLTEWSLERHEPLPEQAEALAHSLAGSSATVGVDSLSSISRGLEHALASLGSRQRAGQPATDGQAQLFVDASEDIRRLLHQFAAGFLKTANEDLVAALYRVVHDPRPQVKATDGVEALRQDGALTALASGFEARPELELTTESDAAPAEIELVAPVLSLTGFEAPAPVEHVAEFTAPHADTTRVHGRVQDIDDDIDVLDTIDVDLFPIFAEEAQELIPQLGSALRQWVARPENTSARGEVLRNLHTLKGSARLAGALRLGELAHRMETTAERLGSDVQRSADVEPLQAEFDAIAARFEQLRNADGQVVEDVVQSAPEQAPANVDALMSPVEAPVPVAAEVAPVGGDGGLSSVRMPPVPSAIFARSGAAVRVRPELLDRLVNQTGEVMITRARMESELVTLRGSLKDLTGNLDRLRGQLRDIELQAETQMQSRLAQARDADQSFDPLEFDRFTRVQELTRMMAESVNDVATVQRNLQRAVESTEDSLVAQARQTRELQRDLLRTRMVEFEGISERLYRVVRQASKETGKQVRLDITGNVDMDRGVLDRMTGAFEHLLRNSVVHGIESPEKRQALGKPAEGQIEIVLGHELNDVSIAFKDDGGGLDLVRLREKALAQGLTQPGVHLNDEEAAQLVFEAGLSTAREVSELAGRGIGMDVVRNDVVALGGRIETATQAGKGSSFKLVLPLTTAVTQVVMLRAGSFTMGVPSNLVEVVRRLSHDDLTKAYATGHVNVAGEDVPFYWAGALMQSSAHSTEGQGRTHPVVIFRSAAQRVAMHVDEVLGNQEVVVKNLGPQLSRLPGLAGMSMLASGAVALIYNPVAMATVYGALVPEWLAGQKQRGVRAHGDGGDASQLAQPVVEVNAVPLVLVVDDSITVRRVTQRLLQREGYRVTLAADGLQALEKLQVERPTVVLSDIEMPRMDGFDLVRNIRNDARLSALPVIMITSRIAEKHREHARELGVDHYLGKPYSEDELLALIGHYTKAAIDA